MLGFTKDDGLEGLGQGENVAKYPPDMTGGLNSIYVYSSCVAPQIVGSSLSSLLRVVPIRIHGIEYGEPVMEIFTQPHYVPVLLKNMNSVDISIKTDQNENMRFNFGKTLVRLHFRKVSVRL